MAGSGRYTFTFSVDDSLDTDCQTPFNKGFFCPFCITGREPRPGWQKGKEFNVGRKPTSPIFVLLLMFECSDVGSDSFGVIREMI